ncbi:hypothetical protein T492DRAFT_963094, partial [Pavlovales sp. CCMP2436]
PDLAARAAARDEHQRCEWQTMVRVLRGCIFSARQRTAPRRAVEQLAAMAMRAAVRVAGWAAGSSPTRPQSVPSWPPARPAISGPARECHRWLCSIGYAWRAAPRGLRSALRESADRREREHAPHVGYPIAHATARPCHRPTQICARTQHKHTHEKARTNLFPRCI